MDFKQNIKQILREGITPEPQAMSLPPQSNGVAEAESNREQEQASDEDYIELTNKLVGSQIINHSEVMRRMKGMGSWGQADATERSLFEKKLKRKKNEEGGTYRFTKQEAQRIKDILNDPYKKQ
jgi:hypothetical protein